MCETLTSSIIYVAFLQTNPALTDLTESIHSSPANEKGGSTSEKIKGYEFTRSLAIKGFICIDKYYLGMCCLLYTAFTQIQLFLV
ncbi:hypothetical protein PMIT1327_02003 [Prochlorococcus marinus str. MIT 1327]|nr:hypothetical protein PMIT1312_01676 [Prochlorococcus marinus str. MIT 1312]KZR78803.1 hypothetical protein PMIT1327_02003 [Prochlorococcus marinus str. MIT 1327]